MHVNILYVHMQHKPDECKVNIHSALKSGLDPVLLLATCPTEDAEYQTHAATCPEDFNKENQGPQLVFAMRMKMQLEVKESCLMLHAGIFRIVYVVPKLEVNENFMQDSFSLTYTFISWQYFQNAKHCDAAWL